MVKFTVWNDGKHTVDQIACENTKFTRELNTYGFDENGIGEEFLFPIQLNDPSGGNQKTNLATYLFQYKEFAKTCVRIKKDADKEWFKIFTSLI